MFNGATPGHVRDRRGGPEAHAGAAVGYCGSGIKAGVTQLDTCPPPHARTKRRSCGLVLGPKLKHTTLDNEHVEAHLVLTLGAGRRRALVEVLLVEVVN